MEVASDVIQIDTHDKPLEAASDIHQCDTDHNPSMEVDDLCIASNSDKLNTDNWTIVSERLNLKETVPRGHVESSDKEQLQSIDMFPILDHYDTVNYLSDTTRSL